MPGKKLNIFIKLTMYVHVLLGIILFSFSAHSQEFEEPPVFEEQESPEETSSPESTSNADETSASAENNTAAPDPVEDQPASNGGITENGDNGDFDVFRPSEEISEDLAVPFPADI